MTYRHIVTLYDLLKVDSVLLCIIKYLPFITVYTLFKKLISKQVTSSLQRFCPTNFLKNQIRNHFQQFVNKFGLHSTHLMWCLRRVHGVIAGGFALATFTGALYETSDMDIYIPAGSKSSFESKVTSSGLKNLLTQNGYIQHHFESTHPVYQYSYYEFVNELTNRKIQVLYWYGLKYRSFRMGVGQSVINTYDFTSVMCFIEGKDGSKNRFQCQHLNDIVNKKLKLNPHCPRLENILQFGLTIFPRLLKYKRRGYTICDSINVVFPGIIGEIEDYENGIRY